MQAFLLATSRDTPDARPTESGVRLLLRDPNYLCIWILGGLTGFIRWFQLLALGVYTFEITESPLLVSLIPVLWGLPLTFCGPLIGSIADTVNRKLLLGVSAAAILSAAGIMAILAYTGSLAFPHIAIASLLSGLFWATDMPVRRRLLGDIAGTNLSAAMGLDSATNSATRMVGPFVGGVMLQLVGITGVYVLSTTVYAVSLLLIVIVQLPPQRLRTSAPAILSDLVAGIRYCIGDWEIRRVLAVTIVFNIWGFPFTAMIPILGREQLNLDPLFVGFLSSLEGFGAFAGAMIVAVIARPANYGRIFLVGTYVYLGMLCYLGMLSYVAGGPYHSFFAASLALTVIGIAGAGFAAMQSTLTYLNAPPELRSRVLGVLALCIGSGPVGFLNVGWLAETFGLPSALVIMSIEGLLAMVLLWVYGFLTPDDRPPTTTFPSGDAR